MLFRRVRRIASQYPVTLAVLAAVAVALPLAAAADPGSDVPPTVACGAGPIRTLHMHIHHGVNSGAATPEAALSDFAPVEAVRLGASVRRDATLKDTARLVSRLGDQIVAVAIAHRYGDGWLVTDVQHCAEVNR